MSSSDDLTSTLQREHERLGAVLRAIAASPAWDRGVPNSGSLSALHAGTEQIRAALDDIERLIAQIG